MSPCLIFCQHGISFIMLGNVFLIRNQKVLSLCLPWSLVFISLVLCPVLGLLFSHLYDVMSVLVKVAGHITGQVDTKVLFTVCYKSEFCLELSYFSLSYSGYGQLVMLFW